MPDVYMPNNKAKQKKEIIQRRVGKSRKTGKTKAVIHL